MSIAALRLGTRRLCLGLVLLLAAPAAAEAPAATGVLEVHVTGFPDDGGSAFIGLYDDEALWLDEDARPDTAARLPIEGGQVRWRVEGLAPGVYAVRVYHDANGNGALDKTRRGVPREAYGFSNDPPPRRGPAPWNDARFEIGPGETRIEITLHGPREKRADP